MYRIYCKGDPDWPSQDLLGSYSSKEEAEQAIKNYKYPSNIQRYAKFVSDTEGLIDPQYTAQKHYTELSPEPIEVIEAWDLGYNLGNAIKYLARCYRKLQAGLSETEAAIKDLEKAASYIRREINTLKGTPSW